MAAFIASMFTAPVAALCTLVQGASCAISTVNLASCLCHSALGRKTGISPTAAKLFYTVLLGLASFVAMILRYHSEKFNFGAFGDLNCAQDGSFCKGDQAVFRISFILVLFFTLMMLLSLGDESFHRGYWGIKILTVIVGVVGSFFIPPEAFNMHAYAWFSRLGSLGFLVLQILILIDFAYQVNDSWVAKAYGNNGEATDLFGEASNRNWLYAILVSAALLFMACIVGEVLMYVFYASCGVGIAFTTISLLSVILMTVLSVFRDKIVKRDMEGAILPTALVSVYVVFLCWSALESNPDAKCRPYSRHAGLDFTLGAIFASITLMWSTFSVTSNAGHLVKGEALEKAGNAEGSGEVELGGPVVRDDLEQPILDGDDEVDDVPVYSNEQPWSFHLIMIAASMYLAMLLTDWGSSKGPANSGEASMWMKIVAQWLTTLLFSWTLIAPAILKDRVFD